MHTSDDLSKTQTSTYKNVDQMREINKKKITKKRWYDPKSLR